MYQPVVREVTVEDGKTSLVHIDLQPNFAELPLIGEGGASLWVNGEEKTRKELIIMRFLLQGDKRTHFLHLTYLI